MLSKSLNRTELPTLNSSSRLLDYTWPAETGPLRLRRIRLVGPGTECVQLRGLSDLLLHGGPSKVRLMGDPDRRHFNVDNH